MAGWLGLAAWVAPGALAAWVMPSWARWRPRRSDLVGVWVGGWTPAVLVLLGTLWSVGVGNAAWDPAGEGLRAWWSETQAGRAAFEVSDPFTVGLGQLGLVLTAPIYALPAGLGVGVWTAALSGSVRVPATAALVGALAALGAAPVPAAWPVTIAVLVYGGLAASMGRLGPWATVAGLGAIQGLPGLGPLVAVGSAGSVGWTSFAALTLAVVAAVVVSAQPGD